MEEKKRALPGMWWSHLEREFQEPYMKELREFLVREKSAPKVIYPPPAEWFNAFWQCPFDQVKVVILGQDPYHGPGQAHGLSFSVPKGIRFPPSLLNILKELNSDLGIPLSKESSGDLTKWAQQGVLLLNAVLTVEAGQPGSHQKKGWEVFTDRVIGLISERANNSCCFVLWGSYAQAKENLIDSKKHLIIKSPHPSPLSAHRGFFGSKPFSKVNQFLKQQGLQSIDWQL